MSKESLVSSQSRLKKGKKTIAVSEKSWGVLHIYLPGEEAFDQICADVTSAYEDQGLSSVEWEEAYGTTEINLSGKKEGKVSIHLMPTLEEDEVLVIGESAPGWIAVASARRELTLPAKNPLAIALSQKYEIFAVTQIEGEYVEYTLYREGQAQGMTLLGEGQPKDLPSLPALDWSCLTHKGRDLSIPELNAFMYDPIHLSELIGIDVLGYRAALESAATHDDHPAHLMVFRVLESKEEDEEVIPADLYESAVTAYQREEFDMALETLEQIIELDSELKVHAAGLRQIILEKIEEKERRGQLIENPDTGSPIELYNIALSLIKKSETNRETQLQALRLLELSSQGGLIQANKLAEVLRKRLSVSEQESRGLAHQG